MKTLLTDKGQSPKYIIF